MKQFFFEHVIIWFVTALLCIFSGCDNGSGSGSGLDGEDAISGFAQKGPFQKGSVITIYELDNNFEQTGTSFRTEIFNDLGEYSLPVNTVSRYAELYADGFFLNELDGSISSARLTLSTISDLTDNTSININFLTSLATPRILKLISEGASFIDAARQACVEILAALGFNESDPGLFEDMDILKEGRSNALLLAASAIIMKMATDNADSEYSITSELIDLLTKMKNDIGDNGVIDDTALIGMIQSAVSTINAAEIRTQLEEAYIDVDTGIAIPDFSQILGENDYLQESEFAGDYKLEFQSLSYESYVDLTIHNQYYITGTQFVPDMQFTGPVYNGYVDEEGSLSFFTNVIGVVSQYTGTITDDTVEGTYLIIDPPGYPDPYTFTGYKLQ